jgi:hypothetical protein
MTGQRWRTYALLLHFVATYKAATWVLDFYGNPLGYIIVVFLAGTCLVGLIVPVAPDPPGPRHRREEHPENPAALGQVRR